MLKPFIKVDQDVNTTNGYFLDHLNNQLYFLNQGKLMKKDLTQGKVSEVSYVINIGEYNQHLFPKLTKVKGQCIFNVEKTLFINQSDTECVVRIDQQIHSGSTWEWYVPSSLKNVKLGYIEITQNNNMVQTYFNLNSSSSRKVSFIFQNDQFKVFVNDSKPFKDHNKKIARDQTKQSKFYPIASCSNRGQTIMFNPFGKVSQSMSSSLFKHFSSSQEKCKKQALKSKLINIHQLDGNRILLITQNGYSKLIQRNPFTNRFQFPNVQINGSTIKHLFTAKQFIILKKHSSLGLIWNDFSQLLQQNSLFSNLQKSILLVKGKQDSYQEYKLLLQKSLILRSLHSNLRFINPLYESQFDRQIYSQTISNSYFNLNKTPLINISKSIITNQNVWVKIQGKIQDISENYLLTIQDQTVIIYHLGYEIKQIFRENIIFFEFNKNSFLNQFNQKSLRILKKSQQSSSIYKILTDCFIKDKKIRNQIYEVKQVDLRQLTEDFRISQAQAKLALQQTGSVQQALVWLSNQQKDRVYIQRPSQNPKRKMSEQQKIKGSIVELPSDNLVKLILHINEKVYLLGYNPQTISNYLWKGEKKYINLLNFNQALGLHKVQSKGWCSTQNHKQFNIIDNLNLKKNIQFLFKQNEKIYAAKIKDLNLVKAQLTFNSLDIYESSFSINLSQFEKFESNIDAKSIIKAVNGEIYYSSKLQKNKSPNTPILFQNKIYSNLFTKIDKFVLIQALLNEENFKINQNQQKKEKKISIPFLITSGPVGCSQNYQINSILKQGQTFLANYSQGIKFQHLHSKYINITSVLVERSLKQKNINKSLGGKIYFQNQSGVQSKTYFYKFENQQNKRVFNIQQKGYWKYMIVQPEYQYKDQLKMPYAIGHIQAYGFEIQSQTFDKLFYQQLLKSLEIIPKCPFQLVSFKQTSKKGISLQLLIANSEIKQFTIQNKNILKQFLTVSHINCARKLTDQTQSQQINALNKLQFIASKQFIRLFSKSKNPLIWLRQIVKSQNFTLKNWQSNEIKKFIDLLLMNLAEIKDKNANKILRKIFENEFGNKYLFEYFNNLRKNTLSLPISFINFMMDKAQSQQLIQNLKDLLNIYSKKISQKYLELRKRKIPYLLFEQNFSSRYYLDLIQQKSEVFKRSNIKSEIFQQQEYLPSEFVSIKDQNSRKLYIKLDKNNLIKRILLRFDKCEFSSIMNFKVFSYSKKQGKKLIAKNRIEQYQWNQITQSQKSQNFNNELNSFPIELQNSIKAEYLQIQMLFTQTGITIDQTEPKSLPTIDMIPQIYGNKYNCQRQIQSNIQHYIYNLFTFSPQESFYLSNVDFGYCSMEKYSITKQNQFQYGYFKPYEEKIQNIKKNIKQKIDNKDYSSAIFDHKKLVNSYKKLSKQINLDYIFTALVLTFEKLFSNKTKIEQKLCESVFELIIKKEIGPIRISAFKAISHSVKFLVKSLSYLQDQGYFPNLEQTSFDHKQIEQIIDLKNVPLCNSLSKLITNSVPYAHQWVFILNKMVPVTQKYTDIVKYILKSDQWLNIPQILTFLNVIPESVFINVLLSNISLKNLQRLILQFKKTNLISRIPLLIDKLIYIHDGKNIDLDIVSMMLQQKNIKWHNLFKLIKKSSQAQDLILNHYLNIGGQNPAKLAENYPQILYQASRSLKHSQLFVGFLSKLFNSNRKVFKRVIYNLPEDSNYLHSDMYDLLAQFLYKQCNYGGIQGSRILTQSQILNLHISQILIRKLTLLDQTQELQQEQFFIQWYFCNNNYQYFNINPANKSPGMILMKNLSQKVLTLIKNCSIQKILKVFDRLIDNISNQNIPLNIKHIYVNQINEGVSNLLGKSINPQSLTKILVGDVSNDMIKKIFESLEKKNKKNNLSEISLVTDKKFKEISLVQKFTNQTNLKDKVKDWQVNSNGSKNVIFKININQKKILMKAAQPQGFILSKIIIGFNIIDNNQKNNIFPSSVHLYGGQNQQNIVKICELKNIQDQHFSNFSNKVFGVNFNSIQNYKNSKPLNTIQFRFSEPLLTSLSDTLQNLQKNKKEAFYSVSFVSLMGYETQTLNEPSYNQIYMTLLSFLSDPKYISTLNQVIQSTFYQQNSKFILKLLNQLLPNKKIQQLILALNKQNEDVLGCILQENNQNPNIQLVQLLLQDKPSAQNIQKLLKFFTTNFQQKIGNIIISTIKLYSYSQKARKINLQVQNLIEIYERNNFKKSIFKVLVALLSTFNVLNFNYKVILQILWKKGNNESSVFFQLIGATIGWYSESLNEFLESGKTEKLVQDTIQILKSKNSNIYYHIYLLSQISIHQKNRQFLIKNNYPIEIAENLRDNQTLIKKNCVKSLKYFILFFQSTCIQSACQQQFAKIIIDLMVTLPNVQSTHHNYFIHQFFFPLINAFKGVPVKFLWKNSKRQFLPRVTHVLKTNPIRPNQNIEIIKGDIYCQKVDNNQKLNNQIDGQNYFYLNKNGERVLNFDQSNKQLYKKVNNQIINLLTNQTLIKSNNIGIFKGNYENSVPMQDSTFQNIFYLPEQMTLNDVLKQINISGFRLNQNAIKKIKFLNPPFDEQVNKTKSFKQLFSNQNSNIVVLQSNPQLFFQFITIDEISKNIIPSHVFIPQQTIFKAFQKQSGLQKMIGVLKTCVKNWSNSQQSKIWEQYLNELQSYSCFPIFSSIYMNKQQNVKLLFNILSGLPDKQDSKKWLELEKISVKFLYDIIKDVFQVQGQQAIMVRQHAIKNGFYKTMLDRLHLISKETKRYKIDTIQQEEQIQVPTKIDKKISQDDYKLKVVKKKGIGYGNDSSSNQKWDITAQQQNRKQISNQILSLLSILEKFIDHKQFQPPKQIVEQSYESALLPIIQSSLRGGSLLQISKSADLFKGQLSFIKAISKKKSLLPILMNIPKTYEPKQHQSIFQLLKVLESTSKIFLTCLTGSVGEKLSQEIAKGIIQTYELVDQAISNYNLDNINQDQQKRILQLPLAKKYPLLLKDLRFDYIDMKDKNGKITKHHYSSNFVANHKSPATKTIRLAQQLADISHALPVQHTNAIYVRCDKQRVDFMQALIMGSNGTPYGHGAYLFDIYFDDTYPNNPPKVNLTTTGSGQIRFNPNLYACGKVCLSLLGTWRGSAMENWDAKVSTLLQILVSIQSIIMSEQVYFNQPGFEHEQGTIQGQKKNEAYANIVRYGNVKFAMLQNIKNPPKGFQHIIRRHFYLKKDQILEQTKKWLKYAQKRQASYNGLVSDHNHNWCNTFKKSKTQYRNMLQKAINELQIQLNKLPQPSNKDLKSLNQIQSPKKKNKKVKLQSKDQNIEQIDVGYDNIQQSKNKNLKELDINDQKVKDRWSRYIGAMGIQAVSKQSKANILLMGLGATGVQIAKNIILSGCKKISIYDDRNVSITDLSGQFFLTQQDLGKNRVDSCLYKLQQLNHYVRVQNLNSKYNQKDFEFLKQYDVVILTQQSIQRQITINKFCHKNNIKFIITDCYGPFGQHFNDFGQNFQVLDKNGEQTVQVMIQNISKSEKGIVTLLNKQRHPYQDGQLVRIYGVKGMVKQNGQSINGTIHKIKVINQYSFEIGDTTQYSAYQIDGTARNMKLPIKVAFKSLQESISEKELNIDGNLAFYDFQKGTKNDLLHKCIFAINTFVDKNKQMPKPWNFENGQQFLNIIKKMGKQQLTVAEQNYIRKFAYTCSGTFAPLAAFYGGLTAQQAFKAITGKYMPINQYFFIQFTQVIPQIPQTVVQIQQYLTKINYQESKQNRNEGLKRIIGKELTQQIQKCRLFLIGSGAIGCQLLKNYAMINLATSQKCGQIIVTDPDHIQESNLNRQFLFRQKHLRKPKSVTAAAAVAQMNKLLKGKIRAKLDRVCESTKDIFSNQFFESLNIVTNALDNVKARQYVDQRCVQNKVALLESGTLSSKGHVQVIIPYITQTYGSKNDPAEDGQIPHCTLKMFPEETLHCVQWARDIFGKTFTLQPKALAKLLSMKQKQYTPGSADLQMLKNCKKVLQMRPKDFDQAIVFATNKFFEFYRNDICQLLYTYPLDAKTKDGKPFWKLPKRPPTPIKSIDPENQIHSTFITSYAVLLCKIFNVPYPSQNIRSKNKRIQIASKAKQVKIDQFIPNDKLAKQMAEQVEKSQDNKEQIQNQETIDQIKEQKIIDEITIFQDIVKLIEKSPKQLKILPEQFQKDDDQNGHIDLIYSMANLRAINYQLEPMDWMTTKLKAGRITPALSTTTSCVAALQTIQLIKYLKKCKLDKMRNTFINLAVPMIQAGEPGQVQKIKVHEQLTTNIWERWDVGPLDLEKLTVKQLLDAIQEKYKITVKIITILQGAQIYSDLVLGLQSKKAEKQSLMKKSLKDVLLNQIPVEQIKKFVDFTLVFSVKDQIAKHVPTLRLLLK